MIPVDWIPYERDDDGELVGYLEPDHDADGECAPVTIFGYRLGASMPREDAERQLDEVGLSYLADRWVLDVHDRDEPISVAARAAARV